MDSESSKQLTAINKTRTTLSGLADEVRDFYFDTLSMLNKQRALLVELERDLAIKFSRISDKISQLSTRLDSVEQEFIMQPLAEVTEWFCPRCTKLGNPQLFHYRGISFIICSEECRLQIVEKMKWT